MFSLVSRFFLQLPGGTGGGIFAGIEFACRQFINELFDGVTKLPNKQYSFVVKHRYNNGSPGVFGNLPNPPSSGGIFNLVYNKIENLTDVFFFASNCLDV